MSAELSFFVVAVATAISSSAVAGLIVAAVGLSTGMPGEALVTLTAGTSALHRATRVHRTTDTARHKQPREEPHPDSHAWQSRPADGTVLAAPPQRQLGRHAAIVPLGSVSCIRPLSPQASTQVANGLDAPRQNQPGQ
jgi:hypothetical protein